MYLQYLNPLSPKAKGHIFWGLLRVFCTCPFLITKVHLTQVSLVWEHVGLAALLIALVSFLIRTSNRSATS